MVSMRSLFAYFWQDEPRVLYFVFCCIVVVLLAFWLRDKVAVQLRNKIVLPALLLVVVFGNPVSAHILVTRAVETQSLRFFWLIPVSLFLAATTVWLIGFLPRRWLKGAAALGVAAVLLVSGQQFTVLRSCWENVTPNWYKIPPVVVDLSDFILADDTYDDKRAAFVFPLNLWVRQYDSGIFLLFSWTGGENLDLRKAMDTESEEPIDLTEVAELAAEDDCYYLVLPREWDYTGSLEGSGYREVYAAAGIPNPEDPDDDYSREYVIYRLEKGAADADHS